MPHLLPFARALAYSMFVQEKGPLLCCCARINSAAVGTATNIVLGFATVVAWLGCVRYGNIPSAPDERVPLFILDTNAIERSDN